MGNQLGEITPSPLYLGREAGKTEKNYRPIQYKWITIHFDHFGPKIQNEKRALLQGIVPSLSIFQKKAKKIENNCSEIWHKTNKIMQNVLDLKLKMPIR